MLFRKYCHIFAVEKLITCTSVLMYNNKFFKNPGKLKTHWLGPYVVKEIIDGGEVKLEKIDGTEVRGLINGSQLKPYFDNCD